MNKKPQKRQGYIGVYLPEFKDRILVEADKKHGGNITHFLRSVLAKHFGVKK